MRVLVSFNEFDRKDVHYRRLVVGSSLVPEWLVYQVLGFPTQCSCNPAPYAIINQYSSTY